MLDPKKVKRRLRHDDTMRRGAERQEFLERLRHDIIDEATPRDLDHCLPLITLILKRFEKEETIPVLPSSIERFEWYFETQLMPAIDAFAKTPEERRKMLADLLLYLATSVGRRYQTAFSVQETEGPLV